MPKQMRRLHKPTNGDGSRGNSTAISHEHSNIAQLAYLRWLERGCPIGSPEEDWFQAEQDLKNERT